MSKATFKPFDAARHLKSEEDIAAFLAEAAAFGDAAFFADALGTAARARSNISKLARQTGLTRQGLIKALSAKGNPSLKTTMSVMTELGLTFKVVKQADAKKPAKKPAKKTASARPARSSRTASAA